jgi:hypothetical protein
MKVIRNLLGIRSGFMGRKRKEGCITVGSTSSLCKYCGPEVRMCSDLFDLSSSA